MCRHVMCARELVVYAYAPTRLPGPSAPRRAPRLKPSMAEETVQTVRGQISAVSQCWRPYKARV